MHELSHDHGDDPDSDNAATARHDDNATSDGYTTCGGFSRNSGELHRGMFLGASAVAMLNAAVPSS